MKIARDAREPQRPNAIYVPRFRNTPSSKKHSQFIRGYGYQGGGGAEFDFSAQGYGTSFKGGGKEGVYSIGMGAFGKWSGGWANRRGFTSNLKDHRAIPARRIS